MAAQPRVILWCHFRSTSTAFLRSMMTIPDMTPFMEPFSGPYYFGMERVSNRYAADPPRDGLAFMDTKKMLEQDYPDSSCLFSKDFACYFSGKLSNMDYLPAGFVHTFLIRNPRESVMSLYEQSVAGKFAGYDYFDPTEVGLKELWELYCLLADRLGERQLFVIDSADLLESPELYLRQYCRHTGLPYNDRMVEWGDEKPRDLSCFDQWEPWVQRTLQTTRLSKTYARHRNVDDYPDVVKNTVEQCQPFYEKLRAKRFVPSKNEELISN